jgi:hypothetical protein
VSIEWICFAIDYGHIEGESVSRVVRSKIGGGSTALIALATVLFSTTRLAANATDGRFVAVTGGIQDSVTGLVWQQPDNGMTYTWANAPSACVSPWRLPTIAELFTLCDMRATAQPAIDSAFTGTGPAYYWSSTPASTAAGGSSYAWGVYFDLGGIFNHMVSSTGRVRCVHQ